MNDDVINVIEKLKKIAPDPSRSKILFNAHPGLYKSFKYYQRIYNLPVIELNDNKHNSKKTGIINQDTYIVSSKKNIMKDDSFTKVFTGEFFEIHKPKNL